MISATLSFTRERVTLRCADLKIEDERRPLGTTPPFEDWSRAYATGYWTEHALLVIGLAIGRWFETQQWLSPLIHVTAPLILTLEADPCRSAVERAALEAPWELLAHIASSPVTTELDAATAIDPALPDPIRRLLAQLGTVDVRCGHHVRPTTIRRLSPVATKLPDASQYRLSTVFMAAQPEGLTSLPVDREEIAIYRAMRDIPMDLAIEDSGSLRGLGQLAAQTECDVIQLSCHGAVKDGKPVLVLEDRLGQRADATADDLSSGTGNKPRLAFLAVCSTTPSADSAFSDAFMTAAVVGSDVLWPLSANLCQRDWPAVLGWPCDATDPAATTFAAALYRQLAYGVALVQALANARITAGGDAWHKARLFLGSQGGGEIVAGTTPRPDRATVILDPEFLDSSKRIRIATPAQPFPHRRALQRVMDALRERKHIGAVVHGGDELSRATFAGRVLQRMDHELCRVVVTGKFDAAAILDAIRLQTANAEVAAIVNQYRQPLNDDPGQLLPALRAILTGPGRSPGSGAFALVLHEFDPTEQRGRRRDLAPALRPVARALISAFAAAATGSRLLFTRAAAFRLTGRDGADLVDSLLVQSLTGSLANITVTGVFLIHCNDDNLLVDLIAADLRACDVGVRIVALKLQADDSFLNRLADMTEEPSLVLALVSSTSVTSRWIAELASAEGTERLGGRVVVLPVLGPSVTDADLAPVLTKQVAADLRRADAYHPFFDLLLDRLDPERDATPGLPHEGLTLGFTRMTHLRAAGQHERFAPWVVDYLVARTRSPDETERYWAYIGLGELRAVHVREVIERGLDDGEFSRAGAITALQLLDGARETTISTGET